MFDLFVSHRSVEKAALQPLRDALVECGLRLWVDDAEIDPFSPHIADHIERGLAKSRVLLAWATAAWRDSRGCQWELTAAAVAGEVLGDGLAGRLLLVCPEGLGPVPEALRGARHWVDPSDPVAVATAIAERLRQIDDRPLEAAARTGQVRHIGGASFDPPRFLGRDDKLWEIHGALEGRAAAGVIGRRAHDVAVVHGLGGVGKTMLAREYSARFSAAYPGGIVLLNGREALSTQLVELLIELGRPVPPTVKTSGPAHSERLFIASLRGSLREALENAGRVLWLVDDLPAEPSPANLDDWRSPVADGRTLITTRSGRWTASGGLISLDALERDAARALLWTAAGGPPSADAASFADGEAILDELGNHALGVDVARALLVRLGVAQLRALVTAALAELDALAEALSEDLPTGHEKAIIGTLRASFIGLGGCARDLLRASALLASAPIPRGVLEAALKAAGWTGAAELFKAFEQTTGEALMRMEAGRAGGQPSLRLHPVVACAVSVFEPFPDRNALLGQALHDRIADEMRPWTMYPWEHGRIRNLLPHAEHLGTRWQEGTGELALLAAETHRTDGNFRAALALETGSVDARRRRLGPDHAATLSARHNQALTISASGSFDTGRTLLEEVLAQRRALLGPDDPDTLQSLAHLSWVPLLDGDVEQARQQAEEVLARRRRVLGPQHPDTVMSELMLTLPTMLVSDNVSNIVDRMREALQGLSERAPPPLVLMGVFMKAMALRLDDRQEDARSLLESDAWPLLRRMQATEQSEENVGSTTELVQTALAIEGDYEGATRLLRETLERRRRTLGPEHILTLYSLGALANARLSNGDPSEARVLFEDLLAAYRRRWPDGSMTLLTMDVLGSVLTQQKDAAARQLREELLTKRLKQFGPEHPASWRARRRLADTLSALGDLTAARAQQEEVLTAYRSAYGLESPETLSVMLDLSYIVADLGSPSVARELLNEALEVWVQSHIKGPQVKPGWGELTNRFNLALRLASDAAWARPFQERVLAERRRALGSDHPLTLEAIGDLAATLRAVGKLDEARQLGTEQLTTYRRVRGSDDATTISAIRDLALTLSMLRAHIAERELLEEVVAANRRAATADDLRPLDDLLTLAKVQSALGETDGAQRLREEAVNRWIQLDGRDDIWAWSLRSVLRWATDPSWARPFQEQVVAARRKALGPDAQATLDLLEDLADTQETLGLFDEAKRSLEELIAGRSRAQGPSHEDTIRAEAARARVEWRRALTLP